MIGRLLGVVILAVMMVGCGQSKPETLIDSGYDEAEMDAAIAEARSKVGVFIAELAVPTGSDHAVKAAIHDGDDVEHFWVTNVTLTDGVFEGVIGNEPGIVDNVTLGQKWSVKQDEISDWLFFRDGKMHGNYTSRPLLKGMSPEQAAEYRELMAEP